MGKNRDYVWNWVIGMFEKVNPVQRIDEVNEKALQKQSLLYWVENFDDELDRKIRYWKIGERLEVRFWEIYALV